MFNLPHCYKAKFGISDTSKARGREVSNTTDGAVDYVWQVNLPYGKAVETFVHGFYAPLRAPFKSGSGRTEWFLTVNPVIFGLSFAARWYLHLDFPIWVHAFPCLFSLVIWLDGLFWLLFFWAVSNLAKAGIIAALGWALYVYIQSYPK